MRRWLAVLSILASSLVAAAAGCGQPGPVKIGTTWPESPSTYDAAYRKWTREGTARADIDLVFQASATLKSAEWRAAYVQEYASRMSLTEDERSKLAAEQAKAAQEFWEVELIVQTHESSWQDFAAAHSMWRLALVGDEGREVLPVSIKIDARPEGELEVWFPAVEWRQQKAYLVTFPALGADQKPLVREGAERLTLEIMGAPGRVKLVWQGI